MFSEKFSETERNRGKADSGKEEAEQSNQEINRNQEKKWNQYESAGAGSGAGGEWRERVGERLRGARSAIQPSSSSPLLGPAAAAAAPIQPSSRSTPTAGGIHTTNGPHARLSFEQTMAQFGFRPRILRLAKGAALDLPLSPDKDLVKGKDISRSPPLTVPKSKGHNNDERQDKTKGRNSWKLGATQTEQLGAQTQTKQMGATQTRKVFTAFSTPTTSQIRV